ncbi:hypothetical protein QCD60_10025 [Pokkaliibacter sp. MBI-7]|uniref:hypothetical protein n=1 Tax=Pokkaliibacter sp. MBI-7 TaxID=3040600 RepID=UPI00244BE390|nr:hypothetical protein [Pokkaliibacter sp. MBI-7]MDH2432902.1 hypothetical protein [Pokkaliibacter sp. MBI-7]
MSTPVGQALIECSVLNLFGERSQRYVQDDVFQLWQFMMYHKHGFQVENPQPCRWLPLLPGGSNVPAGPLVNRVQLSRWDAELQKVQFIERFVSADDTAKVSDLLRRHYSPEQLGGYPLELKIEPGFVSI